MSPPTRRALLERAGSLAAIGLVAGCESATDGDGSDSSPTATATASTNATDGSGESEPDADVEALEERANQFVALLDEGSFEEADAKFSSLVEDRVSATQLENVWEQLEAQHGRFVTTTGMEYDTQQGYDQIVVTLSFERGEARFVVTFGEDGLLGFQPAALQGQEWEAPPYADESSFETRELSIQATDTCPLTAELTLPAGDEPVPGVVLVHGSGPSDMDETIGPNKPLKDLAYGLSSRGIAVLRYDKRTKVCDVDLANATIDDVVTDDALSALSLLREQDRVDEVFLAGHSIGGTLAPRIARRDGSVDGVVMLAGLARPVPDAMLDQNEHLLTLDGDLSDREEERLDEVRTMVERIRSLDIEDDEVVYLGGRQYWRTLQDVDSAEEAAELEVPRLLLQGERDYQVTVEEDLAAYRSAMGDDPDVTIRTYETLNHLFLSGEGTSTSQEYFDPGHVDRAVVDDVATWITDVAEADG